MLDGHFHAVGKILHHNAEAGAFSMQETERIAAGFLSRGGEVLLAGIVLVYYFRFR